MLNAAIFAGGLATSDAAGAFVARFCGTCTAVGDKAAAIVGFCLALICFGVTFSGVVGFYGTNREALAVQRELSGKLDAAQLEWLRNQTVASTAKDKPTMLAEVKAQVLAMQTRGAESIVSDGLAAVLAPVIGAAEGDTRRKSILGLAAALLLIQFGTAWMYGYTRQRLEPRIAARSLATGRQIGDVKTSNDANAQIVFSKMSAREDVLRLLADDAISLSRRGAVSTLARRWGWDNHKVKRFLRSQPDLAPLLASSDQQNVVRLNGNGRAHA